MKTEMQREQPTLSDEKANPEDFVEQPESRQLAYKTVLAAVVIGLLMFSALWMFVIRQENSSLYETAVTEHDDPAREDTVTSEFFVAKTDPAVESMGREMVSISSRIDRGFEAQQTHRSVVKQELSSAAESIQTINEAISNLEESNQELGRRINEVTSRLTSIAKDLRVLKVVKRKPTIKRKPRLVKTPPFQIDAIDVWDDVTYVAVSQAGRVAFLTAGEKQSGWTATQIDRLKGQVDFQGPAGQIHSISLER